MCFICEACGTVTPPRTPSHLLVVETREKVYVNGFDEETGKVRESKGREIVREIQVCPDCRRVEEGKVVPLL